MAAHAPREPGLSLWAAASECPDQVAVATGDDELTFSTLRERADNELEWLGPPSARSRPVLALVARPGLDSLLSLYAALHSKTPVLLLHPALKADQQRRLQQRVGATLLHDGEERRTLGPHPTPGLAKEAQILLCTSGSTGEPKIVMISQQNLLAAAHSHAANLPLEKETRWLLSLPFAHIGGLSVITRCLIARRTVVLAQLRAQDPDFGARCEALKVTHLSLVPSQLRHAMRLAPPRSLRAVLVGGAPVSVTERKAAREARWPILCSYGLTEACSQVATESPQGPWGRDDVGLPLPQIEVRIEPEGTLSLRGPMVSSGYLDSANRVDKDGWLHTTDRAQVLENGRLKILGRCDDVVISGGENISPAWVESQLIGPAQSLGVDALAISSEPHAHWGQQVVGVISAGGSVSLASLDEMARQILPAFSVPKRWVILERLPQLPSGKLDRQKLRKIVASVP